MVEFKDRTEEQIRQDVERRYNAIDGGLFGNGRRDDRDALEAAKDILKKYILEDLKGYEGGYDIQLVAASGNGDMVGEIIDDKGNVVNFDEEFSNLKSSQGWVVHDYEMLLQELDKNIRNLEGTNHYIWTSVAPHIQRLAGRINSAEEKVLINRRLYQAKRDLYDLIGHDLRFVEQTYFSSSEVNGKPLGEILLKSEIVNHPENVYYLDYGKCKDGGSDAQIKNDILEKTGNSIVTLRYDESTKKINYYDIHGNSLDLNLVARKGIEFGIKGAMEYSERNFISEAPSLSWIVNGKLIEEIFGEKVNRSGDTSFTLDYSECKNDDIKSEVLNIKPDLKIDLNYDKTSGSFYFVDETGQRIPWTIKMREGIRVTSHEYNRFLDISGENARLSAAADQFDTQSHSRYHELMNEVRGSGSDLSLDVLKSIDKYKTVLDQLDSLVSKWKKGLTDSEAVDLVISIESRLDEVVYKNKRYGFDLNVGEPVSRDSSGYLQANFVGGSNNVREVLFKVNGSQNQGQTLTLPQKEYNKLFESGMNDYLSSRLKEKRGGGLFDQYELTESFIAEGKQIDINDEAELKRFELRQRSLSKLLSGCDDFKKEYEEDESSQPPELQKLMRELRKYLRTMVNDFGNKKVRTDTEWNQVRDNLWALFLDFKNNDGNWASMTDATARTYFYQIFSGESNADIDLAVKSLCNGLTFLDNTTAHIDPNEYKEGLSITDTNYDFYRKNITRKLSFDVKENPNQSADSSSEIIFEPQENITIIDNILNNVKENKNLTKEEKISKFIDYLITPLNFLPNHVDKKDEEIKSAAESIIDGLENKIKFLESRDWELKPQDYRRKLEERQNELRNRTLSDVELMELHGISATLELSNGELQDLYLNDINQSAELSLRYGGMDSLFDGQLANWLIKKGGGVHGSKVADQINDSLGTRGWRDWSDETCKAAAPFLQDLMVEVAIIAAAAAIGAVTAGAGTAAIATLRATAFAAKAAKIANYGAKLRKFGKIEKILKVAGTGSKKIGALGTRLKNTKYVRKTTALFQRTGATAAGTTESITGSTRFGRILYKNTEWLRETSFWKKGESIGKMIARGNALRHGAEATRGYQFAGFLIEGTGFHVSSTVIRNMINGEDFPKGLNPFGTTEIVDPETGETISVPNIRGYAESISFFATLKAVSAPIQNLTANTLGNLLSKPLTEGVFKKAITNCVSVGGEMVSLGITEQFLNQAFEGERKKMTTEDFIRSLGMVIGLRGTRLMGRGKKWIIKEYDKAKQELSLDTGEGTIRVDVSGNIIESSIDIGKSGDNLYFEGKESRLGIGEGQARENSSFISDILENTNEGNQREQLDKLRKEIVKQYEKVTGKKIELTDEQIFSVIKAHLQEGELGNLRRKELCKKAKTLAETIKDPEVRRFLLEAGFCGEQVKEYLPQIGGILFDQGTGKVTYDVKKFPQIKAEIEEKNIGIIDAKETGIFELHLNTGKIITVYPSASNIPSSVIMENIRLDNQGRLRKAEELLGRSLSDSQKQAIIEAHNQPGEPMNLKLSEIRSRVQTLKDAGFSIEERRILIENGICGRFALSEEKITSFSEELNIRKKEAEEKRDSETNAEQKKKYAKQADLWDAAIKKLNENREYLRNLTENPGDVSVLHETYMKFRNDFKKLGDQNLLLLTKIYKETILDPLGIRVVDPYMTFEGKVDDSFASTDEIFNGNDLINETRSISKSKISEVIKTNDVMKKIRTKEIPDNISQEQSNVIVENYINQLSGGEKAIASKLWESLNNKTFGDGRILPVDKIILFENNISYMLDYTQAYPDATPQKVYKLLDVNQNKLLHQTIQDKSYLTGSDHGILHILRGNLDMAENFFGNMTPLERVCVRQATIDHDLGYTAAFNRSLSDARSGTYFDATKDHPLYSADYVEGKSNWYRIYFGTIGGRPASDVFKDIIASHSSPKTTDLPKEGRLKNNQVDFDSKVVDAVVSVVDCAAASGDYKSAFFFAQPEIMVEFEQVFKSMEKQSGSPNFNQALSQLENITRIIENCPNPKMKGSLQQAATNMHLSNEGGIMFLRNEINEIDGLSQEQVGQKKDNVLAKILKKGRENGGKLEDTYKAFNKFVKAYNKANGKEIGELTFDENLSTEQEVIQKYNEIVENGSGKLAVEAFKNYLKYDKIDGVISFPYKKYIAQFGVRLRTDAESGRKIIRENDGKVYLETELAGSTFVELAETIGPKMALESFFKVAEDFKVEDKEPSTVIKDFKNKLCKSIKVWIEGGKVGSLQDALIKDFQGYGNDRVRFTNEGSGKWRFELTGNNKEKVCLFIDGQEYSSINAVEKNRELVLTKISQRLSELETRETLDRKIALIKDIKMDLTSYLDSFAIDGEKLSDFLDDISLKVETMNAQDIPGYLREQFLKIQSGYQLSTFDIISN